MRIQTTPFGSNPFKRSVAIITVALFLFMELFNFAPTAFAQASNSSQVQGGNPSGLVRLARDLEFRIPPELGKIEEVYFPSSGTLHSTSGKTVVFIQDAHDSLEAQENISKIVGTLVAQSGVKIVFEEGYEGLVPTDKYFGSIKDPEIREKISYFLMDHLRVGGAEYAHINRKMDFDLLGADSLKLHKENIDQYRFSAAKKDAISKDLKALERELRSLADRRFPKQLKGWLKIKEQFDSRKLDLFTYLERTASLFRPQTTDHRPQTKKQPSTVDRGPWTGLLQFVLEAIRSNDPVVVEKARHIDAREVFGEVVKLEQSMAETYLHDAADKQLFEYYRILGLLDRLNDLQVSQEEYEAVKTALKEFDTESFARFIFSQAPKTLILSRMWEKNIKDAVKFYEIAKARDHSLETVLDQYLAAGKGTNALPHSSSPDAAPAVLVYGGFHKENIKRILEAKGISYVVVSPRITKPSQRHEEYYKKLMTEGKLPFELPANLRVATRAESQMEVWDANPSLAKAELRTLISVAETMKTSNAADFGLAAEQALKSSVISGSVRSENRSREELPPSQVEKPDSQTTKVETKTAAPSGIRRPFFSRKILFGSALIGIFVLSFFPLAVILYFNSSYDEVFNFDPGALVNYYRSRHAIGWWFLVPVTVELIVKGFEILGLTLPLFVGALVWIKLNLDRYKKNAQGFDVVDPHRLKSLPPKGPSRSETRAAPDSKNPFEGALTSAAEGAEPRLSEERRVGVSDSVLALLSKKMKTREDWIVILNAYAKLVPEGKPKTAANLAAAANGKLKEKDIYNALSDHDISYKEAGVEREKAEALSRGEWISLLKGLAGKVAADWSKTAVNLAAISAGQLNAQDIRSALAKHGITYEEAGMEREYAEGLSRGEWIGLLKGLAEKVLAGKSRTVANLAAVSDGKVDTQDIYNALSYHDITYEEAGMEREKAEALSHDEWIGLLKGLAGKVAADKPKTAANLAAVSDGKLDAQDIRFALAHHSITYEEAGMERGKRGRPRKTQFPVRSEARFGMGGERENISYATPEELPQAIEKALRDIYRWIGGDFTVTIAYKGIGFELFQLPSPEAGLDEARIDALKERIRDVIKPDVTPGVQFLVRKNDEKISISPVVREEQPGGSRSESREGTPRSGIGEAGKTMNASPRPWSVSQGDIDRVELRIQELIRGLGISLIPVGKETEKGKSGSSGVDYLDAVAAALQIPAGEERTIVDAGSGQGIFATGLALLNPSLRVVGIEYDHRSVQDSQKLSAVAGHSRLRFEEGDFNDPKFAETFRRADAVYYWESGTYEISLFEKTLSQNLKPGARVLVFGTMPSLSEALKRNSLFDQKSELQLSPYLRVFERRPEARRSETRGRKRSLNEDASLPEDGRTVLLPEILDSLLASALSYIKTTRDAYAGVDGISLGDITPARSRLMLSLKNSKLNLRSESVCVLLLQSIVKMLEGKLSPVLSAMEIRWIKATISEAADLQAGDRGAGLAEDKKESRSEARSVTSSGTDSDSTRRRRLLNGMRTELMRRELFYAYATSKGNALLPGVGNSDFHIYVAGEKTPTPEEVFDTLRWGGLVVYAGETKEELKALKEIEATYRARAPLYAMELPAEQPIGNFLVPHYWGSVRLPFIEKYAYFFAARKVLPYRPIASERPFSNDVRLISRSDVDAMVERGGIQDPKDLYKNMQGDGYGHVVEKSVPSRETLAQFYRQKNPQWTEEEVEKQVDDIRHDLRGVLEYERHYLPDLYINLPGGFRKMIPKILTVRGDAKEDDRLFLKWRRNAGPPVSQLDFAIQLAELLTAIHGAGYIHGDVRGANFGKSQSGATLLDYGYCVREKDLLERDGVRKHFERLWSVSHLRKGLDEVKTMTFGKLGMTTSSMRKLPNKTDDVLALAYHVTKLYLNPDLKGLVRYGEPNEQAALEQLMTVLIKMDTDGDRSKITAKVYLEGLKAIKEKLYPASVRSETRQKDDVASDALNAPKKASFAGLFKRVVQFGIAHPLILAVTFVVINSATPHLGKKVLYWDHVSPLKYMITLFFCSNLFNVGVLLIQTFRARQEGRKISWHPRQWTLTGEEYQAYRALQPRHRVWFWINIIYSQFIATILYTYVFSTAIAAQSAILIMGALSMGLTLLGGHFIYGKRMGMKSELLSRKHLLAFPAFFGSVLILLFEAASTGKTANGGLFGDLMRGFSSPGMTPVLIFALFGSLQALMQKYLMSVAKVPSAVMVKMSYRSGITLSALTLLVLGGLSWFIPVAAFPGFLSPLAQSAHSVFHSGDWLGFIEWDIFIPITSFLFTTSWYVNYSLQRRIPLSDYTFFRAFIPAGTLLGSIFLGFMFSRWQIVSVLLNGFAVSWIAWQMRELPRSDLQASKSPSVPYADRVTLHRSETREKEEEPLIDWMGNLRSDVKEVFMHLEFDLAVLANGVEAGLTISQVLEALRIFRDKQTSGKYLDIVEAADGEEKIIGRIPEEVAARYGLKDLERPGVVHAAAQPKADARSEMRGKKEATLLQQGDHPVLFKIHIRDGVFLVQPVVFWILQLWAERWKLKGDFQVRNYSIQWQAGRNRAPAVTFFEDKNTAADLRTIRRLIRETISLGLPPANFLRENRRAIMEMIKQVFRKNHILLDLGAAFQLLRLGRRAELVHYLAHEYMHRHFNGLSTKKKDLLAATAHGIIRQHALFSIPMHGISAISSDEFFAQVFFPSFAGVSGDTGAIRQFVTTTTQNIIEFIRDLILEHHPELKAARKAALRQAEETVREIEKRSGGNYGIRDASKNARSEMREPESPQSPRTVSLAVMSGTVPRFVIKEGTKLSDIEAYLKTLAEFVQRGGMVGGAAEEVRVAVRQRLFDLKGMLELIRDGRLVDHPACLACVNGGVCPLIAALLKGKTNTAKEDKCETKKRPTLSDDETALALKSVDTHLASLSETNRSEVRIGGEISRRSFLLAALKGVVLVGSGGILSSIPGDSSMVSLSASQLPVDPANVPKKRPTPLDLYIQKFLAGESRFHQGGIAYNSVSGLTYDGHAIDFDTGELTGTPRKWSAPSKESLQVGLLALALQGNERAVNFVSPNQPDKAEAKAIDILTRKIKSYEKFDREYPGYGGFLPWFIVSDSGMQPAANDEIREYEWRDRTPALDNGQLVWSLYAAYHVLENKGYHELARRYKAYFDLMAKNAVVMFYEGEGKIRAEAGIRDNKGQVTAANYFDFPKVKRQDDYYLDDPYEGELMAFFMTLFGDWQDKAGIEKIWSRKRAKLAPVLFDTPEGPITVARGHWFSSHEQWKYLVLPYRDQKTARQIFLNSEKARTWYSAMNKIPGLMASVHAIVTKSGQNPHYFPEMGIDPLARRKAGVEGIAPYAAFPVILAGQEAGDPEIGYKWLNVMLRGPKMQGPYGATESIDQEGKGIAPLVTWDGKMTTVLAALGGIFDLTRDALRKDQKYGEFIEIVGQEYDHAFPEITGKEVRFAEPTAEIPRVMPDFKGRSEMRTTDKTTASARPFPWLQGRRRNYLRFICREVKKRLAHYGIDQGKTVALYVNAGADILYPLLAANPSVLIMTDKLPFGSGSIPLQPGTKRSIIEDIHGGSISEKTLNKFVELYPGNLRTLVEVFAQELGLSQDDYKITALDREKDMWKIEFDWKHFDDVDPRHRTLYFLGSQPLEKLKDLPGEVKQLLSKNGGADLFIEKAPNYFGEYVADPKMETRQKGHAEVVRVVELKREWAKRGSISIGDAEGMGPSTNRLLEENYPGSLKNIKPWSLWWIEFVELLNFRSRMLLWGNGELELYQFSKKIWRRSESRFPAENVGASFAEIDGSRGTEKQVRKNFGEEVKPLPKEFPQRDLSAPVIAKLAPIAKKSGAVVLKPWQILRLKQDVIVVVEQSKIDTLPAERFRELLEVAGLNNSKLHLVIPDAIQGKYSERVAELRKVASVYDGFPRLAASEKIPVIGFSDMENDTVEAFQKRLDPRLAGRVKDSAFGLNQAGSFGVGILYALKDILPDQLRPNQNGFRYDVSGRFSAQVLEVLKAYTVISTSA